MKNGMHELSACVIGDAKLMALVSLLKKDLNRGFFSKFFFNR